MARVCLALAVLAGACGRIGFDLAADARDIDATCPTCANGLVAYWPFDETTGTVARDVVGGHDAMLRGQTVGWGVGKRDGALVVTRGYGVAALDLAATVPTAYTIALWFEPSGASLDFDRYFASSYYNGADNGTLLLDNHVSGNGVRCIPHHGLDWKLAQVDNVFATTGWRHVTCSFDGTMLRVFANGVVADSSPVTDPLAATEPLVVGLGASVFSDGITVQNTIAGKLDDVRIYNRALSEAEVAALAAP